MLGAHLIGLVCVVVAGGLGLWQYDAWQRHRDSEQRDLTQAEPVPLAAVLGPDDRFPADSVGQPVRIEGSWLPEATVFISERRHEGTDGYWVVTPMTTGDGADEAIPVVRGWVPTPADAPAAPTGPGDVVGWLQPPEGTGAVDDDLTDDIYPQLRVADLIQRVDGDLYGAYAIAEDGVGGLPAGDLEALPKPSTSTGLRNLLYAIEWWVFGAFAGFIWWRFVRDSLKEEPAEHPVPSST